MKYTFPDGPRVLSVYPSSEGLGYVLFLNEKTALDWGVLRSAGHKNEVYVRKFIDLINFYEPDTIIIRDASSLTPPSKRITELIEMLAETAKSHDLFPHYYSRHQVLEKFQRFGVKTKHEVVQVIGDLLPELKFYQPPPRKSWESESIRMSIFDATALALTYFYGQNESEE